VKKESIYQECVDAVQNEIVSMIAGSGKFKKLKIGQKAEENERVVISLEIGGKYFLQIRPCAGRDHVIAHDIDKVVPMDKFEGK
jgi:hypothetical protein